MTANKIEIIFSKKKSLKEITDSVISTFTSEKGIEQYHIFPPKISNRKKDRPHCRV